MFEQIEIGTPVVGPEDDDGVESWNAWFHDQGVPSDYLVFAEDSLELSTIRQADGAIVVLDARTFEPEATFASLDAWYSDFVRIPEFVPHYGLEPHAPYISVSTVVQLQGKEPERSVRVCVGGANEAEVLERIEEMGERCPGAVEELKRQLRERG